MKYLLFCHFLPPHLFDHSVVAPIRLFAPILPVWRLVNTVGEVELVADLSEELEDHSRVLDELSIVVPDIGGPGGILNRQDIND